MKASDRPLSGASAKGRQSLAFRTRSRRAAPSFEDAKRVDPGGGPTRPQVTERFSPLRSREVLAERFSIERLARRGGMGAVYRALDLRTGLPVAIKVTGSGAAGMRARFSRESQILSELTHPGIVQHVGHGATRDGTLFLAMEWLEGEDLAERLRRGPLGVEASVLLLRGICEALGQAHLRGIVHRDLKPENPLPQARRPGLGEDSRFRHCSGQRASYRSLDRSRHAARYGRLHVAGAGVFSERSGLPRRRFRARVRAVRVPDRQGALLERAPDWCPCEGAPRRSRRGRATSCRSCTPLSTSW